MINNLDRQENKINANPASLSMILKTQKQILIPLYQRSYDWGESEINKLFNDFFNSYSKDKDMEYFIGNIIVREPNSSIMEMVDGQQRITTILIILIALSNFVIDSNFSNDEKEYLIKKISSFIHKDKENLYDVGMNLKILSTIKNLDLEELFSYEPFSYLDELKNISWEKINESKIKLKSKKEENNYLKNLISVYKTISEINFTYIEFQNFINYLSQKILLIKIVIPMAMNVSEIFENINSTGIELNAVDLVKNYLYANSEYISTDAHEKEILFKRIEFLFENKFKKFSNKKTESQKISEQVLRSCLSIETKKFNLTTTKEFYKTFSSTYNKLISEKGESYFSKRLISNIEKISSMYSNMSFESDYIKNDYEFSIIFNRDLVLGQMLPSLFPLFEKFGCFNEENEFQFNDDFFSIMNIIDLYTFKRFLANDKDEKNFNKFFGETLPKKIETILLLNNTEAIKEFELFITDSEGENNSSKAPKLDLIKSKFFNQDAPYSRKNKAIKYIFLKLNYLKYKNSKNESMHFDRVLFDKFSIEHIMPQTISDNSNWSKIISRYIKKGESWMDVHQKYLNNWGNLTLTLDNPSLSNSDWPIKRNKLKSSQLKINEFAITVEEWNIDEIEKRKEQIWKIVESELNEK